MELVPQPATVSWSDLPESLALAILQTAFKDSGSALPQWLRMSLVCRRAPARCNLAEPALHTTHHCVDKHQRMRPFPWTLNTRSGKEGSCKHAVL